jgi:YVTN family beta-propeller protein
MPLRRVNLISALLVLSAVCGWLLQTEVRGRTHPAGRVWQEKSELHRSPIALALSADGTRMLTANQTSDSVSLVDPIRGTVLDEIPTGEKPAGVAIRRDGQLGLVTHWYGYDLAILDLTDDRLKVLDRVEVGPEPRGVVLSTDGKTAYVAVGVANEVVRVDVEARKVRGRLGVGREPRSLALSPDGTRLLVGDARSRSLSIIHLADWTVEHTRPIDGDNLRQVAFDPSGSFGYVASMRNRGFATSRNNIDLGWVLGQRSGTHRRRE